MKPTSGRVIVFLLCALVAAAASSLWAQQTPPAQTPPQAAPAQPAAQEPPADLPPLVGEDPDPEAKDFPLSFGFRFRFLPVRNASVMAGKSQETSTTSPAYNWKFNTTTQSPMVGIGPALELRISRRLTITAEALHHSLKYEKTTYVFKTTGEQLQFRREKTRATLWDFPVLVHFSGIVPGRAGSKVRLLAGATVRTISKIDTTLTTQHEAGFTLTDVTPVSPSRRRLLGGTIGIGLRLLDDFNNKVTPEIRYTRWAGRTFGSDTTQSPVNQIEIGLGIAF